MTKIFLFKAICQLDFLNYFTMKSISFNNFDLNKLEFVETKRDFNYEIQLKNLELDN